MNFNNKGQSGLSLFFIPFALMMAFGGVMEYEGKWGKDGKYAIKNCEGTHTNGNCAHLELTEREKLGYID